VNQAFCKYPAYRSLPHTAPACCYCTSDFILCLAWCMLCRGRRWPLRSWCWSWCSHYFRLGLPRQSYKRLRVSHQPAEDCCLHMFSLSLALNESLKIYHLHHAEHSSYPDECKIIASLRQICPCLYFAAAMEHIVQVSAQWMWNHVW